ncbi:tetratricopeptide repeat protein [Terriglobus sp.]|uniref:tetratricopeptide repeat protein n=1 Tax=Terriglobus sp. TaxID=1889013 RepID=UPI003AFF7C0C
MPFPSKEHARQTLRWAFLVASILGQFGPAHAQDAAVRGALQRGTAAARSGHMAEAEAAFREAVQLAPKLPEVHLDLGLLLAREGKLPEAIASVREAVALNPQLPSAHLFLGIFLFQVNQADASRTELQAELALNPKSVEALTWLGTVNLAQNQPEQAAASLDQAVELSPNDLNLLEQRGRAHSEVARDSYARMAKLEPGSWHVHRVQAQLYAEVGQHAQAITEYQAALKQQPRNPDLLEALGDEYRASSQLDAAEAAYRQEMELAPANPVAMYNVGSVAVERGDAAAGVPLLQAMNKAYPGSPVAQYYLGRGLAASDHYDEAVTWLRRSAVEDHDGEIAKRSWYELTRIYRRLHRTAEAQTAQNEYNRIREMQEKQSTQQAQDWKKLTQTVTP